jgi:hypothetical protein
MQSQMQSHAHTDGVEHSNFNNTQTERSTTNVAANVAVDHTSANVSAPRPQATKNDRLIDFVVKNENDALNGLVSFINLAQRRGAFSVDESAKIWECITIFNRTEVAASSAEATAVLPNSDMDNQYQANV